MGQRSLVLLELRETMCIARVKERSNEWWNKAQTYLNEHPRIGYSVIVFAVASFAFYLGIKTQLAMAFAFISVAVATLFASKSLKRASDAFELTRATQRPFLSMSRISVQWNGNGINPSPLSYIIIGIQNTGSFPADEVSFVVNVWKSKSRRKHLLQMEQGQTSIYLPNVDNPNIFFRDTCGRNRLIANLGDKVRVRIQVTYYNKLTKMKHKTVRAFLTEYNSSAHHDPIPIPDEDYWD